MIQRIVSTSLRVGCIGWLLGQGMLQAQVGQSSPPQVVSGERLLARDNLVAWCIVPFDAARRGPQARAAMLQRLGLQRVAYDWRDEHVATFEQEILAYQQAGLEYRAFWAEHPRAFELFRQYQLQPEIWVTNPSPAAVDAERIRQAAAELKPVAERVFEFGGTLGLYNHGGWGGLPENLVSVCQELRKITQSERIGIVYNLHHAHDRIPTFAADLQLMLPYLLCVNINGMNDGAQPKILAVGKGTHDSRMLDILLSSDYHGPVGIIHHQEALDAEVGLQANLQGIDEYLQSRRVTPTR